MALWSMARVCAETGLSASTIKRLIAAGVFAAEVSITFGRKGFVSEEIIAWNRQRIAARDQAVAPENDPVIVATRPTRLVDRKPHAVAAEPTRGHLWAKKRPGSLGGAPVVPRRLRGRF